MSTISSERKRSFQKIMKLLHKLEILKCAYCLTTFTYEGEYTTPTLDHIIPRTNGGSHHISNLVPCCKTCNEAKGCRSKGWKINYQNYGFGISGATKQNFPLAWMKDSAIIKEIKRRIWKKRFKLVTNKVKLFFILNTITKEGDVYEISTSNTETK